jgi:hypothetical protein
VILNESMLGTGKTKAALKALAITTSIIGIE